MHEPNKNYLTAQYGTSGGSTPPLGTKAIMPYNLNLSSYGQKVNYGSLDNE